MNYTAEEITSAISNITSSWSTVPNDLKHKALDTLAHIMTNVKPPQTLAIQPIRYLGAPRVGDYPPPISPGLNTATQDPLEPLF